MKASQAAKLIEIGGVLALLYAIVSCGDFVATLVALLVALPCAYMLHVLMWPPDDEW